MAKTVSNQRYLMAVRAPNAGIPALADGSWHIIADTGGEQEDVKREAARIIPAIDRIGGDVVVFSMRPELKALLHRGGLAQLPDVADIRRLDPKVLAEFDAWRNKVEGEEDVGPSREATARTGALSALARVNAIGKRTLAASVAVICVPLLAVAYQGGFIGGDAGRTSGKPSEFASMSKNQLAAIRAGSVEMIVTDPNDEAYLQTVRVHPDGLREIVDRFRKVDYVAWNGKVKPPENVVEWLSPEDQAQVGAARRAREARDERESMAAIVRTKTSGR